MGVVVRDLSESVSVAAVDRVAELLREVFAYSPWVLPFRLAFDRIKSRKLPFGLATPDSVTN